MNQLIAIAIGVRGDINQGGTIYNDAQCVEQCPARQENIGGVCVIACPQGQEAADGVCVAACPEGTRRYGDSVL